MCGINCVFDPRGQCPNLSAAVQQMNDLMIYRGPDDDGVYSEKQVVLGMRRLSIIDVTGGRQPLYNEDNSLVLVCNGEIYNYVELMEGLRQRGHTFMSGSDAETILHLYEEKGLECLEELRGMFAFVLWDKIQQRLFAARDRLGIKPLYFSQYGGALWLSSELKAILHAAQIEPTLRPVAVYQYLQMGYPTDQRHTVVEEVKRLLPGEYLIADSNEVRFVRYWTPRFVSGGDDNPHNIENISNSLESSVRLHLRSDVPVGILLSGGIDSSALAAYASKTGQNYTAICAGYAGKHAVDERGQARKTADFLNMPYCYVILDADQYAENFDQLIAVCDEPIADPSAASQWGIYKQARTLGYRVLLSGLGGDEVFFGYPEWNTIGAESQHLSKDEYRKWTGFNRHPRLVQFNRQLNDLCRSALLESAFQADDPLFALRDMAPQGPDAMASILLGSYLVHNGCMLADKLAMGCSVEVRVPLLDYVLLQKVFELPLEERFSVNNNKMLLKKVINGNVPSAVLNGSKKGFSPPVSFYIELIQKNVFPILNGILLNKGWVDPIRLGKICQRNNVMPWLRPARLRKFIGIPYSTTLLYRLLVFEKWFVYITRY